MPPMPRSRNMCCRLARPNLAFSSATDNDEGRGCCRFMDQGHCDCTLSPSGCRTVLFVDFLFPRVKGCVWFTVALEDSISSCKTVWQDFRWTFSFFYEAVCFHYIPRVVFPLDCTVIFCHLVYKRHSWPEPPAPFLRVRNWLLLFEVTKKGEMMTDHYYFNLFDLII